MGKNKEKKALKNWAVFSGIGLQMGFIIFLGNALGSWMDAKFEKSFLEDTVTIIAVFLAMFTVVYRVNRLNNK